VPFKEWRLRIDDILECVAKIERYTDGMAFEDFMGDDKTVDAVLRRIEIIGEAARNVPDEVSARFPGIPWNRLKAMRNVIVHEYFGVSLRMIWTTIKSDLPPLVASLLRILSSP